MKHVSRSLALLVVLTAAAPLVARQAAFDAVSIKENESGRDGGGTTALRNGRWNATNVPLTTLLGIAWQIPSTRVLNAPDWARGTRYDIAAVTAETATQAQLAPMLQALLHERFKAAVHVEHRELPTYNLVPVRADGRLGPAIRRSPIADCFNREAIAKMQPPPRPCMITFGTGSVGGTMTLESLATTVTGASGRPVFDHTNLPGNYELDLKWTVGVGADPDGNTASIFTALQEQLGLKLESSTAPLDVVIVDHIERPTAN